MKKVLVILAALVCPVVGIVAGKTVGCTDLSDYRLDSTA